MSPTSSLVLFVQTGILASSQIIKANEDQDRDAESPRVLENHGLDREQENSNCISRKSSQTSRPV